MPEVAIEATAPIKRIDAAVAQGLALARQAGKADPGLRDAVWELLLEAAASRAHWPDYLRSAAEDSAAAAPTRRSPASAAAVERLDIVLPWLHHAADSARGRDPKRAAAVLFALACGVKVASLRRRLGCGRRTVYDLRDRGVARICGRLRAESAFCRSLA